MKTVKVGRTARLVGELIALAAEPRSARSVARVPAAILFMPAGERTVTATGDDKQPKEMMVAVTALSARRMEAARRQLVAAGHDPFIDYGHQQMFGGDERRSGVPRRFWWDPARGVMGDMAWTGSAAQALTGEVPEFDGFSPHVPISEDGEAAGLYQNCGGLVNQAAFGRATKFSESADLQELVAADPSVVERIDAATGDDVGSPNQSAAEEASKSMWTELIGKLCAAFGLDAKTVKEPELIAAFEQQNTRVTALTARDKAVVVALGFGEADQPKTETLTGKIVELGKRDGLVTVDEHVEALTGVAIKTGLIAPAEKDVWARRLKGADRTAETKELIGKSPSVPLGRTIADAGTAGAGAGTKPKWEARVEELIARDPELSKLAIGDRPQARTRAIERLVREEPSVFAA